LGIKILRFTNNEVFTDLEKIIGEILKTIVVLEPPSGGRGKMNRNDILPIDVYKG
jgi:hypothetical protein